MDSQFIQAITETPNDTALQLVYADYLDEQGDELGQWIRATYSAVNARPQVGSIAAHITTHEPTEREQQIYGDQTPIVGFTPELTEAIWRMRNVGNCNLFSMGPERDNRNNISSYSAEPYTVESWAAKMIGFAKTPHRFVGIEGLISRRDFCLLLGDQAAAAEIDAMMPAKIAEQITIQYKAACQAAEEAAMRRCIAESAKEIAGDEAYLRDDNRGGYDVGVARRLLSDSVECVIVSHTAPTKAGFKIVGKSPVKYYRKSTGGKWGRSAKTVYVMPE